MTTGDLAKRLTTFRAEILQRAERCKDADWLELAGEDDDEMMDVVERISKPTVERFCAFAESPAVRDLTFEPGAFFNLHQASAHAENTVGLIEEYRKQGPRGDRRKLVGEVLKSAAIVAASLDAMQWRITEGLRERATALEKRLAESLEQDDALHRKALVTVDAAEEALRAAQNAALQTGIVSQTLAFAQAKKGHRDESWIWMGIGVAVAVSLLVAVGISIDGRGAPYGEQPWTLAANLSHFAARALGVSVLSFLMVVAFRNYRAAKHNEVTNAHRCGAMATFERFRVSQEGVLKDAVLLQATEAIFSVQPTGYADRDAGTGTHVTELLKVIKGEGTGQQQ